MESATCPRCFKNYSNISAKNKHIRRFNSSEIQIQDKTSHIYCPLCADQDKQGMSSEEKLKLLEAANEFLEEKCQDFDKKENDVEENIIDVETYKDIFLKNLAKDIKQLELDLQDFKKLAAQLTSVVRQFQENLSTKRKMEKQTYCPQPQKKQRKE